MSMCMSFFSYKASKGCSDIMYIFYIIPSEGETMF